MEFRKLVKRRTNIFNKLAKMAKAHPNSNMISILSKTIHLSGNYRTPVFLPRATREAICLSCTPKIMRVLQLIRCNTDVSQCKHSIQRTKSLIIGLIYMTRMGVIWNNVVILAQVPMMQEILPQENALGAIFGVRPKIITETENFLKMNIRCTNFKDILKFSET